MKISSKNEEKVGVYSPWVIFYRKVEALFKNDPEVRVDFDNSTHNLKLYVDNEEKADALTVLMPVSKSFGNVNVTISIVPTNGYSDKVKYLEKAFQGNEAFSHVTFVDHIPDMYISNPITYCVFKKEVVQYPADDLSSESGKASTLYEDLAKDILGDNEGIFFCTDTE